MLLGYAWLAAALLVALPQPASAQGYWYNGQYYTYPDSPPYPGDSYYGPPTSAPPPSPSSGKKSNAGAIAGGVIGGVVGIALLVGLAVWYRRYRARNSSPGLPQTTQSTAATPLVPSTAMPGKTASGGMGYSVGYASNAPFLPSPGPLQAKLPGSLAAVAMPTIPSKAVAAYPAQSGTLTESHVLLVADATSTTNPATTTTNPVTTTGPAGAVQMSTAGSQAALLAGVPHGRGRAADVTGESAVGTSDSGVPRTPGSAMGGRLESRTLDSLRISWSEIQMSGELGRGGFAVVYKGQWCGNRVAVKVLNPDKAHESVLKALYQEALIMSELRSPCLVRVFGLVDEAPHHALVMQYYRKGTLARYMSTPAYVWLDTPARLRMAIQVASGMRHLHARSILHSDLKSSNILLDDDGNAVIADFGLASLEAGTPEEQAVQSGALTISISPPEVLQDPRAPRTQAGDVYAFGIVLLEIMSGRPAYSGLKALDIRHLVISGRRPVIPETVPPAVSAIISNCWQQEPAARPGFGPVLEQLQEAARQLAPEHDDTTTTITQSGMY